MRARKPLRLFIRGIRGLRLVGTMRKNHSLAGLLGVDPENRTHRHPDIERHAAEACAKADGVIGQFEVVRSRMTDVQNDLAVFDMLTRYGNPINGRIDDDMRCVAVVAHPFMHGTNQIGSL